MGEESMPKPRIVVVGAEQLGIDPPQDARTTAP
ncbi:hypothetical protein HD595_007184 [Nonomuraea roseoviolacea subsp. carminata]|uniref:Uncharacterized protein n=1 Tax=Nonomuraea roseoviolacea subsp. carminata TaxID=160689 RepID=A0ABT1KAL1_9ACTN|nr:hypothetical protein [Nonomuraea roseoviolacea subsp. carminata]